jgi:hypothetical protein
MVQLKTEYDNYTMSILKLISEFQERFCNNLDECSQLLDIEYENWNYFKQLILTVAEKLGNPNLSPNLNLFPGCMYILMHHDFKPRIWDAESFVLFLNYVDKELTKIFFYIISSIINHPNFGPYCVLHRQNYCVSELGYSPIHTLDWSCKLKYNGFEFYDALVEINAYFLKFIPVHHPSPFFQSRLPLCDFDVAQFRESSLHQRQQMLVISGLSRLLVSRLFFKNTRLSRQMKTIILRNF